jgi:serine/threonine protein kinase
MPIYEGSMFNIMFWCHHVGYAVCHHLLDIMFPQIILALDYLHEQGLVHGNLKPQNILHRGKQFCLADFGIPKDPKDPASRWYRAPEVFRTGIPNDRSDIFSLGVILLEALETFPQPASRHSIYSKIQIWHSDLQLMASRYGPLIQSMVAIDPRHRPAARDLIGKFPNWHRLNEFAPGHPFGDSFHDGPSALSPTRDPQQTTESIPQTGLAPTLQMNFTPIVKTELSPLFMGELAPTPQNSVPSVHHTEVCNLRPTEREKCIFLNEYLQNVLCPGQSSTHTLPHCRLHCWQAMCQIQRDGASPVWPPSPDAWPSNGDNAPGPNTGLGIKLEGVTEPDMEVEVKIEPPDTPTISPVSSITLDTIKEEPMEDESPPVNAKPAPELTPPPQRLLPSFGDMLNGVAALGAPDRALPASGAPVSTAEALMQLQRSPPRPVRGQQPSEPSPSSFPRSRLPPTFPGPMPPSQPTSPVQNERHERQRQYPVQPVGNPVTQEDIPLFCPALPDRPRTPQPHDGHQQTSPPSQHQQSPPPPPRFFPGTPPSTAPSPRTPPSQERVYNRSRKRTLSQQLPAPLASALPRTSSFPTFPPILRLPSTPPLPRSPRLRASSTGEAGRRPIVFRPEAVPPRFADRPQLPAKLAKVRVCWAEQEKPHQRGPRDDDGPPAAAC